jgi:hypothetical protein
VGRVASVLVGGHVLPGRRVEVPEEVLLVVERNWETARDLSPLKSQTP